MFSFFSGNKKWKGFVEKFDALPSGQEIPCQRLLYAPLTPLDFALAKEFLDEPNAKAYHAVGQLPLDNEGVLLVYACSYDNPDDLIYYLKCADKKGSTLSGAAMCVGHSSHQDNRFQIFKFGGKYVVTLLKGKDHREDRKVKMDGSEDFSDM